MAESNSTGGDSLPAGWTEVEDQHAQPGDSDPRPIALFEREGEDVGVQVFPTEPNSQHAERDQWRVSVTYGTVHEPDEMKPVADAEGREAALTVARAFMAAYENAEGPNRVEQAMESL